MWRLAVAVVAGALLVWAANLNASRVLACSNPTYDLVKDSDVIVEGRYVSYEVGEPRPLTYTSPTTGEEMVLGEVVMETIGLDVVRVFKGTVAGTRLTIVNQAWVGGPPSGSCGSAPSDPTGRYTIAGFLKHEDETVGFYGSFFHGDGPGGASYRRALTQLAAELPSSGTGPQDASPLMTWTAVSLALAGAICVLAATIRRQVSQ
jgi:hypothetical protein